MLVSSLISTLESALLTLKQNSSIEVVIDVKLKELFLNLMELTEEAMVAWETYRKCRSLIFDYSNGYDDQVGNFMKSNSLLQTMKIFFPGVGGKEIASALTENQTLKAITLDSQNYGGDATIEGFSKILNALKVNKTLEKIRFNHIDFDAEEISAIISENPTLHSIEAIYCRVEEESAIQIANALKGNCVIQSLNLANNEISNLGAGKLAEVLEEANNSLQFLDLHGNYILNLGVEKLANSLKINQSLLFLNLGRNRFSDEGSKNLALALENNHTLKALSLYGTYLGEEGIARLADALSINTCIQFLDLGSNDFGNCPDAISQILNNCRSLRFLDLSQSSCDLSSSFMEELSTALTANTTLEYLVLRNNDLLPNGGKKIATAIMANHTLVGMDLSDCYLGVEGITHVAAGLKINTSLKNLVLQGNNEILDEGYQQLLSGVSQSCLESFVFTRSDHIFDIQFLIHLLNNKHSRLHTIDGRFEIFSDGWKIRELSKALENNDTIHSLDLDFQHSSETRFYYISKKLKKMLIDIIKTKEIMTTFNSNLFDEMCPLDKTFEMAKWKNRNQLIETFVQDSLSFYDVRSLEKCNPYFLSDFLAPIQPYVFSEFSDSLNAFAKTFPRPEHTKICKRIENASIHIRKEAIRRIIMLFFLTKKNIHFPDSLSSLIATKVVLSDLEWYFKLSDFMMKDVVYRKPLT